MAWSPSGPPEHIEIMTALPLIPVGKIDKKRLVTDLHSRNNFRALNDAR